MKYTLFTAILCLCVSLYGNSRTHEVDMSEYDVLPGAENISFKVSQTVAALGRHSDGDTVVLRFMPGRYDFYPQGASEREMYISNHDQVNPKKIGILLENLENVVLEATGAEFAFHGRMLPVAVSDCRNVMLRGFSIDFDNPHISQVRVVESTPTGIVFMAEPWVRWRVNESGAFEAYGDGWNHVPQTGIAFDPSTRHIVYRTSDLWTPLDSVSVRPDGSILAPRWTDSRLVPGTVVALRTYARPAPAVFMHQSSGLVLDSVKTHYAEGMGLLAQLCRDITLAGFSVCLKGENDPRYFTTQADATHFSGCEGHIDSKGGLYEGMMDDAINVHGTYLAITSVESPRTLRARYMHPQTFGLKWGEAGDSVRLIKSRTMEYFGESEIVESIEPVDSKNVEGAKEFRITLTRDVEWPDSMPLGIENLRWTPLVTFAGNVVRNNRARGALFSTPRPVVVEENLFDHTSGTAILLCGDCNGWYETGACRDVLIRRNKFVSALTNMFQFTEAVISIYPEIPDIDSQQVCFHGGYGYPGIRIEDNLFSTFDAPLLYAKSVSGLRFAGNTVDLTDEYPAFHTNRYSIRFINVRDAVLEDNIFNNGYVQSVRID